MLDEESVGPGFDDFLCQEIGAIGREVVRNDDFNLIEDSLILKGVQAALDPSGTVVVEDDDRDEGRRHQRRLRIPWLYEQTKKQPGAIIGLAGASI